MKGREKLKDILSKQNILYIIFFVALFIFMAFRAVNVGTDNATYQKIYYKIASGEITLFSEIEFLFSLLCLIFSKLGFSYLAFQIVVSIFILTIFFVVISKLSLNKNYSIFLFVVTGVYFFSFNAIRQSMSICFVLLGILLYLKKNKMTYYFLFVFIACLFHKSAILMIPCILLFKREMKLETILFTFSITFLIMLNAKSICIFLSNNFSISYIDKYISTNFFEQELETRSMCLTLFYYVFFIFITYLKEKKLIKIENWTYNFFILFVLARSCSLFGVFPYLFLRVADLFNWALIFLIPQILYSIEKPLYKKLFFVVITLGFIVLFVLQYIVAQNSNIFPYSFAF